MEELLSAGEARVLEMVAADKPLASTLDALARVFEAQAEGMLASILLLDDGGLLRHGAAPSLPDAWKSIVDGQPIGPNQGSCGAAAFLKQTVIVKDIRDDPRWASYRDAALSTGLQACWSVPIIGSDDAVLGTFALYYREPREPSPRLLELARRGSNLATIAIQHHRHEAAILESEARARMIVDSALDANVLMDGEGTVVGWNVRAVEMFGWQASEAIGKTLSSLIIPERYRARHDEGLRNYLTSKVGPILNRRMGMAALHRDGHEFPVELAVAPITPGERLMFSAFIQDKTSAARFEEALRESREHLSLVYDHVADIIFQLSVEPDGYRFLSVNPAFRAATGLDAKDVIGKFVHEVIPEPSRSLAISRYAEAIRSKQTMRWEETTVYPSGTRFGDVSVTPVFDAAGQAKYLVGSVRDMTDRRDMEDQVRQLQKLEALGQLSGGVAHDFNNLLGVIIGIGNMLLADVTEADQRAQVEEIVSAGEAGAALTRQILAFSRKQVLQPEVLDLNGVVRSLDALLRRLIRENVSLSMSLANALWRVNADRSQIEQVVVNLAVNARDAMPDGGKLVIETGNIELDSDFARTHLSAVPGPYVMLVVSDTGHGMTQATQKRVFEPFFTTKEQGKGTGLGLATVYGIVKQSGGYISVDSVPGEGTTFRIYLPRSTAKPGSSSGEHAALRPSLGRQLAGVRVLIVEDEPALARAFERMLIRLKCVVTVASSADEALAALAEHGVAPDIVITDMILPGISGMELTRRLRVLRPELTVLLMSGYVATEFDDPATLDLNVPFLQKPFTIAELAIGIQRALVSR